MSLTVTRGAIPATTEKVDSKGPNYHLFTEWAEKPFYTLVSSSQDSKEVISKAPRITISYDNGAGASLYLIPEMLEEEVEFVSEDGDYIRCLKLLDMHTVRTHLGNLSFTEMKTLFSGARQELDLLATLLERLLERDPLRYNTPDAIMAAGPKAFTPWLQRMGFLKIANVITESSGVQIDDPNNDLLVLPVEKKSLVNLKLALSRRKVETINQ